MKTAWRKSFIVLGGLAFVAVAGQADVLTGPIVNPANGHSYYLLSLDTWSNSEAQAVSLGGHLVTINDQAENDWVYSTFTLYGGVRRDIWLGFTDQVQEGNFVWISGETPGFTHWWTGEPNNLGGSENFAEMTGPGYGSSGYWNDIANDDFRYQQPYGVVEIPEPSSSLLVSLGVLSLVCVKKRGDRL